ncbi:hypothetical protein ACFFRB_48500 [Kibdelosporangium aridum subsp. largum]
MRAEDLLDARDEEWTSRQLAEQRTPLLTWVVLGGLVAVVVLALGAVFLPRGAWWARIVAMVFALLVVAGSELLVRTARY